MLFQDEYTFDDRGGDVGATHGVCLSSPVVKQGVARCRCASSSGKLQSKIGLDVNLFE